MMANKPLMLKDYLELDAISDSCTGFVSPPRRADATTVRFLLEADLCGGRSLIRSRSKGALTRISAVINAVKNIPLSSPTRSKPSKGGFLPRSISKKLKRSFRKKWEEEEDDHKVRVKDIVRLNSFDLYGERRSLDFLSPVVSSCSSCFEGDSTGSDFLLPSSGSSECFGESDAAGGCTRNASVRKSPNPISSPSPKRRMGVGEDSRETTTGHREPKEAGNEETECRGCQCEEEKEQLSPVSVMDFPYQDDADEEEEEVDGATSPCFQQSLANIERTKHQLLQKIRRFESLAELDPVDLEQRFASFEDLLESSDHVASDEEEERGKDKTTAWDLLQRLRSGSPVGPQGDTEKLLVDFFIDGLSCSSQRWIRHRTASPDVEELLTAASDWINGGSSMNAEEDNGKVQLNEMESNGGWRHFEDGEDEVASDVEVGVLGWLLEELVLDLVPFS